MSSRQPSSHATMLATCARSCRSCNRSPTPWPSRVRSCLRRGFWRLRQHCQLYDTPGTETEAQQLDLRGICDAHSMAHSSHIRSEIILRSGELPRARERSRHVLRILSYRSQRSSLSGVKMSEGRCSRARGRPDVRRRWETRTRKIKKKRAALPWSKLNKGH